MTITKPFPILVEAVLFAPPYLADWPTTDQDNLTNLTTTGNDGMT